MNGWLMGNEAMGRLGEREQDHCNASEGQQVAKPPDAVRWESATAELHAMGNGWNGEGVAEQMPKAKG